MRVYLNELSFNERSDIDVVLMVLTTHIDVFRKTEGKLLTRMESIGKWLSEWENEFDATSRYLLPLVLADVLQECEDCEPSYYYYHLLHQDVGQVSQTNISDSSLANAADRSLLKHLVAILNIPDTSFAARPDIHILKSPHDKAKRDQLSILPCFNTSHHTFDYIFLNTVVLPIVAPENHLTFANEFWELRNQKYTNAQWQPKTYAEGKKLAPAFAFPASAKQMVKSEMQKWKIHHGSYESNVAEYKRLGELVLRLHGYTRNEKLSRKYDYEIYEGGLGTHKLLISLDTENGLLEVLDGSGYHIGVYNYVGEYKKSYVSGSKDHNDHSIQDVPRSMFLFA